MIVPCENVQELSPSLRGVGCCPQDFFLSRHKDLFVLATHVCVLPECMRRAVSRSIRFRGCIAAGLGGCEIDPITKIPDKERDSFNPPGDWTLSLQASSRIWFIGFYLCYLV